jgi:hypothetical protein
MAFSGGAAFMAGTVAESSRPEAHCRAKKAAISHVACQASGALSE